MDKQIIEFDPPVRAISIETNLVVEPGGAILFSIRAEKEEPAEDPPASPLFEAARWVFKNRNLLYYG